MDELQSPGRRATHGRKIDLKSGFYVIRLTLGCGQFTAFHNKFSLDEYKVMGIALCNPPVTFQREINGILGALLGSELVIRTSVHIDQDEGMVFVVYINDILIATKGSPEKHHKQVA